MDLNQWKKQFRPNIVNKLNLSNLQTPKASSTTSLEEFHKMIPHFASPTASINSSHTYRKPAITLPSLNTEDSPKNEIYSKPLFTSPNVQQNGFVSPIRDDSTKRPIDGFDSISEESLNEDENLQRLKRQPVTLATLPSSNRGSQRIQERRHNKSKSSVFSNRTSHSLSKNFNNTSQGSK